MEKAIRRYIAEYEEKIVACDRMIDEAAGTVTAARVAGDGNQAMRARIERHEWKARRQAYVQAVADFKSLIDEI